MLIAGFWVIWVRLLRHRRAQAPLSQQVELPLRRNARRQFRLAPRHPRTQASSEQEESLPDGVRCGGHQSLC